MNVSSGWTSKNDVSMDIRSVRIKGRLDTAGTEEVQNPDPLKIPLYGGGPGLELAPEGGY